MYLVRDIKPWALPSSTMWPCQLRAHEANTALRVRLPRGLSASLGGESLFPSLIGQMGTSFPFYYNQILNKWESPYFIQTP